MRSYRKTDIQDILHKIDDVRSDISSLKKQTDYKSGLICPQCGTEHDRDINAAINILHEGLKQIA